MSTTATIRQRTSQLALAEIESTIKQVDRRMKISGTQWCEQNVPQVLRQRISTSTVSSQFEACKIELRSSIFPIFANRIKAAYSTSNLQIISIYCLSEVSQYIFKVLRVVQ